MSLSILFMSAQALAGLPALEPGTVVLVVAEDLRTIYARGTVDGGELVFDAPLPVGVPVQLLFQPPSSADAERAAPATMAAPGLQSLRVSVTANGQDLFTLEASGPPVSLREWLQQERGISLVLPPQ